MNHQAEMEMVRKTIWTTVQMYAERNTYTHLPDGRNATEERLATIERLLQETELKFAKGQTFSGNVLRRVVVR